MEEESPGPSSAANNEPPRGPVFEDDCAVTGRGRQLLERLRRAVLPAERLTDEFERIVGESGLVILAEGQARIVVHEPGSDCVAKISKSRRPFQNETEATVWTADAPDGAKDLFAPILDFSADFGYVIQSKVDRVGVSESEQIEVVRQLTVEHGIHLNDYDADNFGTLDGDPVVFDYGTAHPIADSPKWDDPAELFRFEKRHIQNRRNG